MRKIFELIAATSIISLLSFGAHAQPSPPPSPWIANGQTIYYNNGGAVMPSSVTGGSQGIGTFNVSGGYYINGVSVISAGCTTLHCAFTNVANTFTASPQTVQGLTTTSPGWYAQITGDTNARVRVGLNNTDIASIAFGPGNAVRDAFIERLGAGSFRLGAPDAAAPVAQTLGVQNVIAGTSNTAGAALTIEGSQGTGTGVGGGIIFQVAPAGSTGTTQNALVERAVDRRRRGLTVGTPTSGDKGAGTLNVQGLIYSAGNVARDIGRFPAGAERPRAH